MFRQRCRFGGECVSSISVSNLFKLRACRPTFASEPVAEASFGKYVHGSVPGMSALSGFIVRFLGCMCSSRTHGVWCLSPKKVASFTERAGFDVGVCLLRKICGFGVARDPRGG